MLIHPFEATFPELDAIPDINSFIKTTKEDYRFFQSQGYFQKPESQAMYVYQISKQDEIHLGLMASVSVQEYIDGHIKKHEHTLVPKEERQAILLDERKAVVKPILLVHRSQQALSGFLNQICTKNTPVFEFYLPKDKTTHRFWAIKKEEDISFVQDLFKTHIQAAYIADGHHRFSAIARLFQRTKHTQKEKYAHLMCALFSDLNLEIHNFNRVIKAFSENISPYSFLVRLSHYAIIEPLKEARIPKKEHELTFFMKGEWFSLEWRPEILSEYAKASLPILDVSMLNYCILENILAIENIRNHEAIQYLEGPKGLKALANLAEHQSSIAFCLYPIDWESFFRVIDHGLVLPPKSTWFEPRMLNGLIVQQIKT